MRTKDGNVVSPSQIVKADESEIERLDPLGESVFGQLSVATGPVLPAYLRRLFRLDRHDLKQSEPPLAPPRR